MTSKRSLENYLAPQAIRQALGVDLATIGDDDDVPKRVARQIHQRRGLDPRWEELPHRTRKRLRNRAKKKLNTLAVEQMTTDRLAQRDPAGEVRGWLAAIAELMESAE